MYFRHTLDNGLRIIGEKMGNVRSVSIGIWFGVGSKYESSDINGISHFIEHMIFKGTESKTAKDIAEIMDSIGGQLNAFTGKECTCYYAKVLDNHLEIAVDILADMIFNSKFAEEDIYKEKSVVIEEINMYEDSPEDLIYDILYRNIWPNNSMGFPILGDIETIQSLDRKAILDYFNKFYVPKNTVISIAGNFDIEKVIKILETYFGKWENKEINYEIPQPVWTPCFVPKSKDIEQLHLCLGLEAMSISSDKLYPISIFNNALGGGMSSRLFQKIREDKGFAYSIFSYPSLYKDTGIFTIYAAINHSKLEEVYEIIIEELKNFKVNGITNEELKKFKEQLKGNYILGLESTNSRMSFNGKSELLLNKIETQDEVINKIDAVELNDVNEVINEVINFDKLSIAIIGNFDSNPDLLKRVESLPIQGG